MHVMLSASFLKTYANLYTMLREGDWGVLSAMLCKRRICVSKRLQNTPDSDAEATWIWMLLSELVSVYLSGYIGVTWWTTNKCVNTLCWSKQAHVYRLEGSDDKQKYYFQVHVRNFQFRLCTSNTWHTWTFKSRPYLVRKICLKYSL